MNKRARRENVLPSECLISCHDNRGEEEKEGERYREEMGEGEEEEV